MTNTCMLCVLTKYALVYRQIIINTTKTKVMSINTTTQTRITINNEELEVIDDFVYLGSLISKDNSAQKDIQRRLGQACSTYTSLHNI